MPNGGSDGHSDSVYHSMGAEGDAQVPVVFAGAESVLPPVSPPSPTGEEAVGQRILDTQEVTRPSSTARPTGQEWDPPRVRERHRGLRGCLAALVTFLHSVLLALSCGRVGKCEFELQDSDWWGCLWRSEPVAEVPGLAEEGRAPSSRGGEWRAQEPSAPVASRSEDAEHVSVSALSRTESQSDHRHVARDQASQQSRSDGIGVQRLVVHDSAGTRYVVEREEQEAVMARLESDAAARAADTGKRQLAPVSTTGDSGTNTVGARPNDITILINLIRIIQRRVCLRR